MLFTQNYQNQFMLVETTVGSFFWDTVFYYTVLRKKDPL